MKATVQIVSKQSDKNAKHECWLDFSPEYAIANSKFEKMLTYDHMILF